VDSEWERLLLNWVHIKLTQDPPKFTEASLFNRPYPDEGWRLFYNLDTAASGCRWWCCHYSQTLRAVLTACGLLSRHVGNVSNYREGQDQGSRTHGVTDVFVQEFAKWVQFDAHYDVHYEKDGIPLSPWEIGEEWFRNQGADVDICVGPDSKKEERSGAGTHQGDHESSKALWNRHRWNTDPFTDHGTWFYTYQLHLVMTGPRHDGIYCCDPATGEPNDDYFNGRFQFTTRLADVYPDVGTSRLELGKGDRPGTVRVQVGTYTPNFDTVLVRVNNRTWSPTDTTFLWFLRQEENTLEVRTRDKFGNLGRISSVRAVLKKKG
jgi:hypothetical protein